MSLSHQHTDDLRRFDGIAALSLAAVVHQPEMLI
jgi:hypothetical protein